MALTGPTNPDFPGSERARRPGVSLDNPGNSDKAYPKYNSNMKFRENDHDTDQTRLVSGRGGGGGLDRRFDGRGVGPGSRRVRPDRQGAVPTDLGVSRRRISDAGLV